MVLKSCPLRFSFALVNSYLVLILKLIFIKNDKTHYFVQRFLF